MDEKNNFSNRDNYKNGYGKGKKPDWKEIAKREKEWANKTSDEMAVKVGNNMSDYLDYLDIQSRFEMYSASNCLLILNQDKNATYLREYKKWKEDGYEVTDSNKKVIIVKPETVKKEDGSTLIFYKAKRVYDVTNTNAPKLEPKEIPDKETMLLAIFNSFKWKVEPVDTLDSGALARYNPETDTLYVCRGGDVDSKIQDVVQETAKRFLKIDVNPYAKNTSNQIKTPKKQKKRSSKNLFSYRQIPSSPTKIKDINKYTFKKNEQNMNPNIQNN